MNKFYIADWHYNHANAIAFDNRPFTSVEEMNEKLIQYWNDAVGEEDEVYILGDMFWCTPDKAVPILDKLNGKKFLIKGNHDKCVNAEFVKRFEKITEYMEIKDGDRNVVLCHYPIPCFKNHYYGWYHLYGHVHNSFEFNMMQNIKFQMKALYDKRCKMYNVGVMMPWIYYTPRTLSQIISKGE